MAQQNVTLMSSAGAQNVESYSGRLVFPAWSISELLFSHLTNYYWGNKSKNAKYQNTPPRFNIYMHNICPSSKIFSPENIACDLTTFYKLLPVELMVGLIE